MNDPPEQPVRPGQQRAPAPGHRSEKRKTGTPQIVIGIIVVVVILARGGAATASAAGDTATMAGVVGFNLAAMALGIVLIVLGARKRSANRKADREQTRQQYGHPGPGALPADYPGRLPAQQPPPQGYPQDPSRDEPRPRSGQ